MFLTMERIMTDAAVVDFTSLLDLEAAVFDWIRLGVFTGTRAGEYAQTATRKGTYSSVPFTNDAGVWGGYPVAFVASDFTLLSAKGCTLDPSRLFHAITFCNLLGLFLNDDSKMK